MNWAVDGKGLKAPFNKVPPEGQLGKLQATEVKASLSTRCKNILAHIDKSLNQTITIGSPIKTPTTSEKKVSF